MDDRHETVIPVETTGQAYLELLRARGIEYFFGNAGTDFGPLVDAFAKFVAEGKDRPRPITVPHEFVAVSMAHGFTMCTGRPQVVMAHTIVGTANCAGALINAARANIPLFMTAGRTPLVESGLRGARDLYIHWAQEAYDQAGMIREFLKWDYELRNFVQLETVVDRALAIATAEPHGIAYLTLPREVLAEPQREFRLHPAPGDCRQERLRPDPALVEKAAALLALAEAPLLITTRLGRDPSAVEALVRLSEAMAIPVVEFNPTHVNFPSTHPHHLGFDPAPFLQRADVIIVAESDVPWFPSRMPVNPGAKVIHLGADPLFARYPIRTFPMDVAIRGETAVILGELAAEGLRQGKTGDARIAARSAGLRKEHDAQRGTWRSAALATQHDTPVDFDWLSWCIGQVVTENTVLVNEYDLRLTQIPCDRPGAYFSHSPAGCLGWGVGAALGAKLAHPERTVIAGVGDGAYIFSVPTAAHMVSATYDLPILVVIFNNGCWGAVRKTTEGLFPQGWAKKTGVFPLSDLKPSPAYEKIVEAHGGYGERVDRPEQVRPALQRALKEVQERGRQAVLNVICKPD
ncbi:MAG TPA: thiamine pyrophosphate-requiring protein [Candidatus Methylomirabilis sp.]|nr:thiamine pyrophosphate-requiring protein [Candidatus Methylomirabilis sp.]